MASITSHNLPDLASAEKIRREIPQPMRISSLNRFFPACRLAEFGFSALGMIKFLHTRIRVRDIDASVAFYEKLGYKEADRKSSPQGNQLTFLELPGNDVFLELCHSPDYTATCPEDLMHTCLGVSDIIEYCGDLEKQGLEIWPGGWLEKFSSGQRKMAFVTDPDGYEVEILENK